MAISNVPVPIAWTSSKDAPSRERHAATSTEVSTTTRTPLWYHRRYRHQVTPTCPASCDAASRVGLTARVKLRGPERKRGSRQLQRGVRHAACLCINRKKDTRPPHAIETAFPTVDGDMASAICPPTSQPKRRIGLACGACPPGARPPARRPRARSRSQLEKTLASARALATRVPANSPRFRPNRPPLRSQAAKPLSRRARRWSPPWSREDLADSRTSPTACDTLSVLASRRSAPTQQLATLAACVGDLQRCQNTSKTTGGRRSKMRQTCWSRTRAAFNRKPSAISSR